MELVWVLTTGGYCDGHSGPANYYSPIEINVSERKIKLSEFSKLVWCVCPEIDFDNKLEKEIRDKISTGTSFLCKQKYRNGERVFGYYFINSEGKLDIKPLDDNDETIYKQFINLLVDTCVYHNIYD
jgi:hypothetical protein